MRRRETTREELNRLWHELEDELQRIRDCRVCGDFDPASLEDWLLTEQRRIEHQLGLLDTAEREADGESR